MSPKLSTSLREWGTRYDTLGSSSPPSSGSPTRSPPLPPSSTHTQINITSVTPTSTPAYKQHLQGTTTTPMKTDKMPQDASIFVGSLPSNMDPGELGRLLKDHLSDYSEVKSVKVIRDTKNRVCAFIQCEDAPSAAHLMESLHTRPPGIFYGRHLRFEAARGFRTLLISYRTPTELHMNDVPDPHEGRTVEKPLHTAIRMYRPPGNRHIAVLYDDEAKSFAPPTSENAYSEHTNTQEDVFGGEGVLFSPLSYDVETVRQMAELFGPLEHFTSFASADNVGPHERVYPHNASRSSEMDEGIWEIKWRNRDDCVAAFATLRQLPHLSVTKAQRMANDAGHFGTPGLSTSPYHSPYSSPYRSRTASYPYSPNTEYHRFGIMPIAYPSRPMLVPPRLIAEASHPDELSPSQKWSFAHSTPLLHGPTSPLASSSVRAHRTDAHGQSPQWSETDFPPLHGFGRMMDHDAQWVEPREIREEGSEKTTSDSPSSLSVQPSTPVPPLGRNATGGEDTQGDSTNSDAHVQELTIPPTPEFSVSSLTPITPRTGTSFPRTPQSADMRGPAGVHVHDGSLIQYADAMTPKKGARFAHHNDGAPEVQERYLDPLTIFVGGLEMFGPHAWNEGRLWELFRKYGEVENVQLVKPPNKKSAFSFVRFRTAEASSRAVASEHNRIYDGRQIRVQLRDTNHQRSPWKLMRGRGRVHHFAPPPRLDSEMGGEVYAAGHPSMPHYSEQSGHGGYHGRSSPGAFGFAPAGSTDSMITADSATVYGDSSDPKSSSASTESLRGMGQLGIQRSASTHPSTSTTPSSVGYPTPVGPMPQYTMPPMGYFPPQWMHAYPSYPYPVPFMHGYMGYAPPAPQSQNSGDSSSTQPGSVAPSNGYKLMHPYPAPNGEQTPAYGYPPMVPHVGTQPPLRATGFIQGEHDTLIPVYQPEALNQYMSGMSHGVSLSSRQNESPQSAPPVHAPLAATASTGSQPAPVWQPYSHMPMYPYVYHPPPMVPYPGQPPMNAAHPGSTYNGWVPVPAPSPYPAAQAPQGQASQAPGHPPLQHHPTPPPYGIPTPPVSATSQGPPHRLPPPSPGYPHQQTQGPQNHPTGPKHYSRREGFTGNGRRPANFNNRSLSQGSRPGMRRSPEHGHGYQAMWGHPMHS